MEKNKNLFLNGLYTGLAVGFLLVLGILYVYHEQHIEVKDQCQQSQIKKSENVNN